jgi:hypothetical protein
MSIHLSPPKQTEAAIGCHPTDINSKQKRGQQPDHPINII